MCVKLECLMKSFCEGFTVLIWYSFLYYTVSLFLVYDVVFHTDLCQIILWWAVCHLWNFIHQLHIYWVSLRSDCWRRLVKCQWSGYFLSLSFPTCCTAGILGSTRLAFFVGKSIMGIDILCRNLVFAWRLWAFYRGWAHMWWSCQCSRGLCNITSV